MNSTPVIVYLNNCHLDYRMFRIDVAPEKVRLRHIKNALSDYNNHPLYKYSFLKNEFKFGMSKTFINNNYEKVPIFDDRVICFISPNSPEKKPSNLSESLIVYSKIKNLRKIFDDISSLEQKTISGSNFFSKSDLFSNSLSPKQKESLKNVRRKLFEGNDSGSNASLMNLHTGSPIPLNITPPPNYEYIDNLIINSNNHIILVTFYLEPNSFLGIRFYGRDKTEFGLLVQSVQENGLVSKQGSIQTGDRIIEINGISLYQVPVKESLRILRKATENFGPLEFKVVKSVDGVKIYEIWDDTNKNFANSSAAGFCCDKQKSKIDPYNKSQLKNIMNNLKQPGCEFRKFNHVNLSVNLNEVFLGGDLIQWLMKNVTYFDKNQAKCLVKQMLIENHIKPVMYQEKFSKNAYYFFVETPLGHESFSYSFRKNKTSKISPIDQHLVEMINHPRSRNPIIFTNGINI